MPTLPNYQPNPVTIINWRGRSGQVYAFELEPVGAMYRPRPGVYIFCSRAPNGYWNAVYIGETDSFQRRLSTDLHLHHKWQRIRAAGATHICTLHVPGGLALREGIETNLRQQIPTPCNDQ